MESKCILEKSSVGTSVGGVVDFNYRPGRYNSRVPAVAKSSFTPGPIFYKCVTDGGSTAAVKNERTSSVGSGHSPGVGILQNVEKVSSFSKLSKSHVYPRSHADITESDGVNMRV